jgi:hypothetical protein
VVVFADRGRASIECLHPPRIARRCAAYEVGRSGGQARQRRARGPAPRVGPFPDGVSTGVRGACSSLGRFWPGGLSGHQPASGPRRAISDVPSGAPPPRAPLGAPLRRNGWVARVTPGYAVSVTWHAQ